MDTSFSIQAATCKRCGACVEVCPSRLIFQEGDQAPQFHLDRTRLCAHCGHCMAVCSTQSVHTPGLEYERDFFALPTPNSQSPSEPFFRMIATRRALRSFQDRAVPRELLEQIVQAIQYAPPSFPQVNTEVTLISDPALVRTSLLPMIRLYDGLVRIMRNPLARLFVRLSVTPGDYASLRNHVIPLMEAELPALKAGQQDTILRHAPALILFHASRHAENYRTDCTIAMTYALLAANSLGLGGTPIDLVPPAVERSPELRRLFQIPDGNRVTGALILGFPKVRFQRGIRRSLKSITWIEGERSE